MTVEHNTEQANNNNNNNNFLNYMSQTFKHPFQSIKFNYMSTKDIEELSNT
jgi:hypothetical protein